MNDNVRNQYKKKRENTLCLTYKLIFFELHVQYVPSICL